MRGQFKRTVREATPRYEGDDEQPNDDACDQKMADTICDRSRRTLESLYQSEKLLNVIDGILQGPCPDGEKMASAEGGLEGQLSECSSLAEMVARRLQKLATRLGEP